MTDPKVSVIIPVHNAGHYFERCLISLLNQTLAEIEIILVIDCPTDGSDKLAEIFAKKDTRIKLLYNEQNLHTGYSRNKGIEIARGKYIGFHDHDDYCDPNMYQLLYEKAEQEDFDVVRCNYSYTYPTNTGFNEEQYKYPSASTDVSNKKWLYEHVSNDSISCVIWNHIYKASFLQQYNIQFLDSKTICSEDSIFFIQVYNRLTTIGIVPNYLYCHVFHSNNTGKVYSYRSIQNRIAFFNELYSFLRKNELSEQQSHTLLSRNIARSLYSGSRQALLSLPLRKAIIEIQYIRKNEFIITAIDSLYKKENSSIRSQLKPTTIIFFFIIKLLAKI